MRSRRRTLAQTGDAEGLHSPRNFAKLGARQAAQRRRQSVGFEHRRIANGGRPFLGEEHARPAARRSTDVRLRHEAEGRQPFERLGQRGRAHSEMRRERGRGDSGSLVQVRKNRRIPRRQPVGRGSLPLMPCMAGQVDSRIAELDGANGARDVVGIALAMCSRLNGTTAPACSSKRTTR